MGLRGCASKIHCAEGVAVAQLREGSMRHVACGSICAAHIVSAATDSTHHDRCCNQPHSALLIVDLALVIAVCAVQDF